MACSLQSRRRARASICSAVFGLLCLTASSLTATAAPAALNTRPNIVVVVVDAAGYTDFGAYTTRGAPYKTQIPGAQLPGVEHKVYRAGHYTQEDVGEDMARDIIALIARFP